MDRFYFNCVDNWYFLAYILYRPNTGIRHRRLRADMTTTDTFILLLFGLCFLVFTLALLVYLTHIVADTLFSLGYKQTAKRLRHLLTDLETLFQYVLTTLFGGYK